MGKLSVIEMLCILAKRELLLLLQRYNFGPNAVFRNVDDFIYKEENAKFPGLHPVQVYPLRRPGQGCLPPEDRAQLHDDPGPRPSG